MSPARRPSPLELKVPPVAVALLVVLAMGLATRSLTGAFWISPGPWRLVAGLGSASLGAGLALAGVGAFRRRGTTVDPRHPEAAGQVVRTGVYGRTRNPMYLGLALGLLGGAVGWGHPLALLGVPAFVAYLDRYQIRPEERALRAKFGAAYEAYLREVPRWL